MRADHYLREHISGPLGMEHTDLARSERVRSRLATGYVLRSGGLKPVRDYEVPTPGGGVYSIGADMTRYLAALLNMEAHRPALQPEPTEELACCCQDLIGGKAIEACVEDAGEAAGGRELNPAAWRLLRRTRR